MKKNTLIIIVITAVMLFLGGTALFFGYKYFTVDNKCEKVKCNNNVNDGNNDKKNCNCPTETKKANNMTDEEILDNIIYLGIRAKADSLIDKCTPEADDTKGRNLNEGSV